MPTCFIAMPITTPTRFLDAYGGDEDHFLHVLDHLFVPAIEAAGLEPIRPIAEGGDVIHAEIVKNLENADLVLCDISTLNANVFFELGIRTALDRPVALVRDEHTGTLPFDTSLINCPTYRSGLRPWQLEAEVELLARHVRAAHERAEGHNALWKHFGLTQRGIDAINAVPDDPGASAMQLVLDEVRQLRHEVDQRLSRSSASSRYLPRALTAEERAALQDRHFDSVRGAAEELGPHVVDFIDDVQAIARRNDSRVFFDSISPERVVLSGGGMLTPSRQRAQMIQAGRRRGIDVRVV